VPASGLTATARVLPAVTMPGTNGLPRSVHDLEEEFAGLAGVLPDAPEKHAISVMHGIVRRLDQHPEIASQLAWVTGGRVHSPTIRIGDQLLVQPSTQELHRALARYGVI
jgi:hypothetical protein